MSVAGRAIERDADTMDFITTRHPDRDIKQSFPIRSQVRGWFFRVDELPTGYWQVKGRDQASELKPMVSLLGDDYRVHSEED